MSVAPVAAAMASARVPVPCRRRNMPLHQAASPVPSAKADSSEGPALVPFLGARATPRPATHVPRAPLTGCSSAMLAGATCSTACTLSRSPSSTARTSSCLSSCKSGGGGWPVWQGWDSSPTCCLAAGEPRHGTAQRKGTDQDSVGTQLQRPAQHLAVALLHGRKGVARQAGADLRVPRQQPGAGRRITGWQTAPARMQKAFLVTNARAYLGAQQVLGGARHAAVLPHHRLRRQAEPHRPGV